MSRKTLIAALALPLLAIVIAIARAELSMTGTRDYLFEIGGFDPRDPLRGHYLQFRVLVDPLPEREPCNDASGRCCLCLTRPPEGMMPLAERATCETARTRCDGALHTRYLTEPQRYYVPELDAPELERRLLEAMQKRRAHAVLAVDPEGEARIRELRIDGETIKGGVPK